MQQARTATRGAVGDDGALLSSETKEALLLAAVQDACAAITQGILSNTANLALQASNGTAAAEVGCNGYISAATRLQGLLSGTSQLRRLLSEYEAATLEAVAQETHRLVPAAALAAAGLTETLASTTPAAVAASSLSTTPAAAENSTARNMNSSVHKGGESNSAAVVAAGSTVAAVRASVNAKRFADECELSLPVSELRNDTSTTTTTAQSKDKAGAIPGLVQSLGQLLLRVREVRRAAGFQRESELCELIRARTEPDPNGGEAPRRSDTAAGNYNGNNKSATVPLHLPLIVKRLEEAMTRCTEWMQNFTGPAATPLPTSAAKAVTTIAAWPAPLLRLLNETVERPALLTSLESTEEQLRRVRFDVEELAQEQAQAVTDGDMHRSEELYFQQADLLEAMKPHFEKLEQMIEAYRADAVVKPRQRLQEAQAQLRSATQEVTSKEAQRRRRAEDDLQRLHAARETVTRLRESQRAGLQLYGAEWGRVFDDNVRQQGACLKAMDELERRLRCLAEEQAFLVQDRIEKLRQERQRAEDAEAFAAFVDQRGTLLRHALASSDWTLRAMKEMSSAVEFGVDHLQAYLKDVLEAHVETELLRTRQARLAQFRELYLTLGDLHFKKARHAEEIEKKVEYYGLQQEIAMDTLSSKAKEYSQAKKKWQAVHDEIDAQIAALERRSEKEVTDFRPTEQLLIEAGVQFKHPQDELAERNMSRTMKLLEYKKLMEEKVSEATNGAAKQGGGGGGEDDAMTGTFDHTAMEEELREIRRARTTAPCLQSTEEYTSATSSATRRRK